MIRTDHRCVPLETFKALVNNSQSSDILNIMHSINIEQSFSQALMSADFFPLRGRVETDCFPGDRMDYSSMPSFDLY